ncbi:hypothetical protein [Alkalibacterium sp. MB6]|uniref:hypothetical protein n=1 Tax=Alkalibacterium sp. MB6 TaxID=2081965 RepID=UPI00137A2D38|nr:hypothetical protein [Alkalibacterium sp. MB6]
MKLLMYGVNRDSVSADDIHKYRLDERTQTQHLKDISDFIGVEEVVLLITENRNEYYLYVDEKQFKHGDLLRYLSHFTGKTLEETILETYSKFNEDVVKHLMSISSNVATSSNQVFEPVEVIDHALVHANTHRTVRTVLHSLFKTVVEFSLALCEKESIEPLLQSDIHRSIKRIKASVSHKKSVDYLVLGHHPITEQVMKNIIGKSNASVTFIDRMDYITEIDDHFKQWLTMMEQANLMSDIQCVGMNQLLYRLSKADVVIIGPSIQHSWISEDVLKEVQVMRPYAKVQQFFDFSQTQDETVFHPFKHVEYTHISDEPIKVFSDDKVEESITVFDDILSDWAKRYMDRYEQLQVEETPSFVGGQQATFYGDYSKKVCSRA